MNKKGVVGKVTVGMILWVLFFVAFVIIVGFLLNYLGVF